MGNEQKRHRIQLRDNIVRVFNDEEIKDICFELDVDYENLKGEGKSGKVRELLALIYRTDRLKDLVEVLADKRSNITWLPKDEMETFDDANSLLEIVVNGELLKVDLQLDYSIAEYVKGTLKSIENEIKQQNRIHFFHRSMFDFGNPSKECKQQVSLDLPISIHNISSRLLTTPSVSLAIKAHQNITLRSDYFETIADLPSQVRLYNLVNVDLLYPDAWRTMRFQVFSEVDLNPMVVSLPLELIVYSTKKPTHLPFFINMRFDREEVAAKVSELKSLYEALPLQK